MFARLVLTYAEPKRAWSEAIIQPGQHCEAVLRVPPIADQYFELRKYKALARCLAAKYFCNTTAALCYCLFIINVTIGLTMQPEQPLQPGQVPLPAQPAVPAPAPLPTSPLNPVPKKSKKPLLIVLGIALLLLTVVAVLLFILAMPGIQARAKANSFMNAVRAKDYAKISDLTGSNDNSNAFIDTTSSKIGSDQKVIESEKRDSSYGIVLETTGGSSRYARVIIASGKVTDFIVSNSRLAPFGGSTTGSNSNAPAAVAEKAATNQCLTDSDLSAFSMGAKGYVDPRDSSRKVYTTGTVFFNADSSTYASPDSVAKSLANLAAVYKSKPNAAFTVELQASVRETDRSASGDKLAVMRADKYVSDAVALGIPRSKFASKPAVNYVSSTVAGSERNVSVQMYVPVNCASSANGL